MDRSSKIIIVVLILLILGYLGLDFLCQVGVKCKNCPRTSLTIEDSRKADLLVAEYTPVEHFVKLANYEDSIFFTKAWAESKWFLNSDFCLFKRIEKSKGFNITVELNKDTEDYIFDLDGYGVGFGMGINSKTVTMTNLRDTLTFIVRERNPDPNIGWTEQLTGQRVTFIRTN